MEKPKAFWVVVDSYLEQLDEKKYTRKEDSLAAAANWVAEERCTVHVYQCVPVLTYNPMVEKKSWD